MNPNVLLFAWSFLFFTHFFMERKRQEDNYIIFVQKEAFCDSRMGHKEHTPLMNQISGGK